LPSAPLIAKNRKAIRDVVDKLNGKLLDAQELQRHVLKCSEATERSAVKARADIMNAFDALLQANEVRHSKLLQQLVDGSADHRSNLERDKHECSTALVDTWRTIDFLEKVLTRGTDVEILQVKGHIFKENDQLRQFEHWRSLANTENLDSWSSGDIIAGWKSHQEADNLLRALANVGTLQVSSLSEISNGDSQNNSKHFLVDEPGRDSLQEPHELAGAITRTSSKHEVHDDRK